jgi:hypothetical protein
MARSTLTPFRFFIFSCRDPRSDFRVPLVRALRQDFETWYILLKRRPVVSGPRESDAPREMSLIRFLAFMRAQKPNGKIHIYFNSTNTAYPLMTGVLRLICARGIWCLDMHDDLMYHHKGVRRLRDWIAIRILRLVSDVTIHAAPTLKELFADSQHLGNASEMTFLRRPRFRAGKVLILASVDDRFDFELVSRIARRCPNLEFDVYGQILPFVRKPFQQLIAANSNIRHFGSYVVAELPTILARYSVTLAPYLTGARQTRYIDPLRFYHCLNSGMEVVTTNIPQAECLNHAVHIIDSDNDFAALFTESGSLRVFKQPSYKPINWAQRAHRLIEIVRSLPRLTRLS